MLEMEGPRATVRGDLMECVTPGAKGRLADTHTAGGAFYGSEPARAGPGQRTRFYRDSAHHTAFFQLFLSQVQ